MNAGFPQAQDSLALRDIHPPPAPPWWPPAPGWWLLFGALCVAGVVAYVLHRKARKKRGQRRRVLAEIDLIAARHPHDDAAYAASLHQLLRRAARRYAPDAPSVQGERWKQVLAQVPVDAATLDALITLDARMYQPKAEFDRLRVQAAAYCWLDAAMKHHKSMEATHA